MWNYISIRQFACMVWSLFKYIGRLTFDLVKYWVLLELWLAEARRLEKILLQRCNLLI